MLFSIIVPIFNVDSYLVECLNSIRNQTYTDFECIMVNDGSTDGSSKICEDFAQFDHRFIYIKKKNGGLVSARKAGADKARGDFIINVDGDDFIEVDLLERMQIILSMYNVDLISFGFTKYTNKFESKQASFLEEGVYDVNKIKYVRSSYMYSSDISGINSGRLFFNICTKCIKRDIYIITQQEVSNLIVSGEDTLFTMYLLDNINSMYSLDYYGYIYRMSPLSIEHTFNENVFVNLNNVLKEMKKSSFNLSNSNNILVYYFYRLFRYIIISAKNSKDYNEFSRNMKKVITPISISDICRIKIFKHNFSSILKLFLLKHRCWFVIYLLSKTYFKNVDM